jgi:glutathione S-transferase
MFSDGLPGVWTDEKAAAGLPSPVLPAHHGGLSMKLMYAPQSPFARKARAAAIELCLEESLELVYVKVVPGLRNDVYAQSYNPLRKIPALVVNEHRIILDSTVICEFLDCLAGGGRLFPRDPDERWSVLSQHALAQGVCEAAIAIRYETSIRPEAMRWQGWIDDQRNKILDVLSWFDANPRTLDIPNLNIAHLALMSGIGYIDFRFGDSIEWRKGRPSLSSWVDAVSARPCFTTTVPVDSSS